MRGRISELIIQYLKNNWLTYLLIIIFFLGGIVFGAFGVRAMSHNQSNALGDGLNLFLNQIDKTNFNKWDMTLDAVEKNLTIFLAIYILGMTIIGVPLIMVIIFTRGFRLGFTIGFLIQAKAFKGVLLTMASIVPHNLIYIPVYLIAATTSVAFSVALIRGRFVNRALSLSKQFIKYSFVMVILALLVIGGGLMEAYVTPVFVKFVAVYIN